MSTSDCWLHRGLVRDHCRAIFGQITRGQLSRCQETFETKKPDTNDLGSRASEERYPV
jgi:hypothetical protein